MLAVAALASACAPRPTAPRLVGRLTPVAVRVACGGEVAPRDPSLVAQRGVGFSGCTVGDALATCEARFGPSLANADYPGEYASWPGQGIEVAIDPAERITTVFVKFAYSDDVQFLGTVDGVVRPGTTVEDVYTLYGASPTRDVRSVESQYGAYPGVEDHWIDYPGISFTFYGDCLGTVAITR